MLFIPELRLSIQHRHYDFFFLLFFGAPQLQHKEVPRLGVE